MTLLRFDSIFLRFFLSFELIDCSGIFVIFELVISISVFKTLINLLFFLLIFNNAPVSSITSIALSGRNLSLIYLDESSIADFIDTVVYYTS